MTAAEYIARDSVTYAATFVQEVREAAASLDFFAARGRVVPEFADETVRELLLGPYRLVYSITGNEVIVLALVHGAGRIRRI